MWAIITMHIVNTPFHLVYFNTYWNLVMVIITTLNYTNWHCGMLKVGLHVSESMIVLSN